jgi:hypothetical protein
LPNPTTVSQFVVEVEIFATLLAMPPRAIDIGTLAPIGTFGGIVTFT